MSALKDLETNKNQAECSSNNNHAGYKGRAKTQEPPGLFRRRLQSCSGDEDLQQQKSYREKGLRLISSFFFFINLHVAKLLRMALVLLPLLG